MRKDYKVKKEGSKKLESNDDELSFGATIKLLLCHSLGDNKSIRQLLNISLSRKDNSSVAEDMNDQKSSVGTYGYL
jgi:hypothetical protein